MARTDGPRGRQTRGASSRSNQAVRERAQDLTRSGMPFQMAMAVAQGRLELNDALERLARRAEVERLMRKHDLNRALATQIAMGHADLEAFLAKRRMESHRQENRDRSVLDEAAADGLARTFGLHGQRVVTGVVTTLDAYQASLKEGEGEPELVHKLQFKYAYMPDDWKKVKKAIRKDKALAKEPREPITRPQDRYTISDKRLFRYMDQGTVVDVTLLEGEAIRGAVKWFGRYEFGLEVKGGYGLTVFRHALHHVGTA